MSQLESAKVINKLSYQKFKQTLNKLQFYRSIINLFLFFCSPCVIANYYNKSKYVSKPNAFLEKAATAVTIKNIKAKEIN